MNAILSLFGITNMKAVAITLFASFLWVSGVQGAEMRGTAFGPPEFDRHNSGGLACTVHGRPNLVARGLVKRGSIVAHRTLSCWTEIVITNVRTGRSEYAVVADRGPYGANARGIDVWEGAPDEPGVAKRIGLNGDETVNVVLTGRVLLATDRKRKNVERANF